MPVVTVETWEGRSVDQKRRLVEVMTAAMVEHFDCKAENTFVIIHDIPKESWGHAGQLSIDK
jgi:4-oxalocrotonate tautomerase